MSAGMRRVAAILLALLPALAHGAREPRTLKLRFPRVTVPARANVELCAVVRVPRTTAFDLGRFEVRHRAPRRALTARHFLVYAYTGERLGELAAESGRVVESRGCLDVGPADRDRRHLVFASAGRSGGFPPGLALPLVPVPAAPGGPPDGLGLVLDVEWINISSRPQRARTLVVLRRARDVRRRLVPIFERSAESGLRVPPAAVVSTEATTAALNAARPGEPPVVDAWRAAADACVLTVSGHLHKRGAFIGVDLVGADGVVRNPAEGGAENPFEPGRRHLFGASDYTDPGLRRFFPALRLAAGEQLRYACWLDNGVRNAVRLGCEETSGVPPGEAVGLPGGGPAKRCTIPGTNPAECPATDAAHPGRAFTGRCVPANAVAGASAEDEACALTGLAFDAVSVPGAECDPTRAP
jgi:hypothetical protein